MATKKTVGEEIPGGVENLQHPDYALAIPTTPTKAVHEAWSDVMNDILALAKSEKHDSPGAKFMYRGIDALMNVCGPVFRKHRVMVIPRVTSAAYRDVQTSGGKPSRETTLQVQYQIIGPAGDSILGVSAGEAMDGGDKGTAKAMSVAMRVFLLQSLCLPTDEPDPDSEAYQRAGGKTQQQSAQDTANRVPESVSVEQLDGVTRWCDERGLLDLMVRDADGNGRTLRSVIDAKIDELDPTVRQNRNANVSRSLGGGEPNPDREEQS